MNFFWFCSHAEKKVLKNTFYIVFYLQKSIFSLYLLGFWVPTHSSSWYVPGDGAVISVLAQVQHRVIMEVNLFSTTHCVHSEPNEVFIVITLCLGCYSHHCLFLSSNCWPVGLPVCHSLFLFIYSLIQS